PAVGGTGAITCSVTSSLANGAGKVFTVVVRVARSDAIGSTITNTATVAAPGALPDPIAANNSATAASTVSALTADLSVNKTASTVSSGSGNTVVPGREITYTITTTNNGPSDTTGTITVTDILPSGTPFARVPP